MTARIIGVINYSQSSEQAFILSYFGPATGRFLDIGAYDGLRLSNTRALLEQGWSGVLVEPSAANLVNLAKNCEPFADRVHIVQAAVTDKRGLAPFFIDTAPDREWSTTINPDLMASGSVIAPSRLKTSVATIVVADLLPLGPFDFISIDAEWEDGKILAELVLDPRLQLARMICIEARSAHERMWMRTLLEESGFALGHETRENLIMVQR